MTLRRSKSARARYLPRSPAQLVAFTAFRLRALWHQSGLLTGERQAAVRAAVDAELDQIGFETETARDLKRRAEWARGAEIEEKEIPW